MSFNTFPSVGSSPGQISAKVTFRYPEDTWVDPDVVTTFEDQQSVEVQSTGSGGFWGLLTVLVQASEADADTIMTFLQGQRLRGIPFYFNHRKRGTILVRYWPQGNPPSLPYRRAVAGNPDLVEFELPLRQEIG